MCHLKMSIDEYSSADINEVYANLSCRQNTSCKFNLHNYSVYPVISVHRYRFVDL